MIQIKKGNLVKIPQSSILYEYRYSDGKRLSFIPIKEIKKPEIGIYLSNLNDEYSEIILGDNVVITTNNNIFPYKEDKNVN